VLRLPEDDYNDIEISDPYLLREYPKDKLGIIDVKLKTKSKKIIHIEIQLSVTPELKGRIVYYVAKLVTEQLGSGIDFNIIKKVISIVITDEPMIDSTGKYHHRFVLCEPETGIQFTDLIEINTLELCKLPEDTDGTTLYDWSKFIAAENEDELDKVAKRNQEVEKAVVKLKELSADERARELFESQEILRRENAAQKRWAVKQREYEIAKNAMLMNMDLVDIIKLTGLTSEELAELQNTN
jgi:predicted transposase/invertase (TIGR01784 family)